MTTSAQRFYIRSPDGRMIVGFDDLDAAGPVALDYGEGAHLVDTKAQAYHPIAQEAIVHAFLAKGADPNTKDDNGAPAMLWALARGKADVVELLITYGADVNARDAAGTSALDRALERNKPALVELLQRAGSTP